MGELHTFSKKEIAEAVHDFTEQIRKTFGEVWSPPASGRYMGVSWDCTHPVAIYGGIWRLCETARHKGALRAFGKIEVRDTGSMLRFIIFFRKEREDD